MCWVEGPIIHLEEDVERVLEGDVEGVAAVEDGRGFGVDLISPCGGC